MSSLELLVAFEEGPELCKLGASSERGKERERCARVADGKGFMRLRCETKAAGWFRARGSEFAHAVSLPHLPKKVKSLKNILSSSALHSSQFKPSISTSPPSPTPTQSHVHGNARLNSNRVCGEFAENIRKSGRNLRAKLNVRKWRRCVEKPSSAGDGTAGVGEASVEVTFPVFVLVSVRGDARTVGKALVVWEFKKKPAIYFDPPWPL